VVLTRSAADENGPVAALEGREAAEPELASSPRS
jgi:hypothetical protein